jgi:hypothetical protein
LGDGFGVKEKKTGRHGRIVSDRHRHSLISKNSNNKVTQLYWVIIFIPPIYTQTIVRWVAKEGEKTTTQTPTLPFTPNPSLKKPKKLNPNTLFFFFSYIDTYPKNLILETVQVQTEEP